MCVRAPGVGLPLQRGPSITRARRGACRVAFSQCQQVHASCRPAAMHLHARLLACMSHKPPRCLHLFCRTPSSLCPPRSFITAFVTLFATVIAITKDLPDIEGDKQFGIETFATRMGVR